MTDLEYPPQKKKKRLVDLLNGKKQLLFRGKMEVWSGEPIGDWVEFRGIRIALRNVGHNKFEGLVPDKTE